ATFDNDLEMPVENLSLPILAVAHGIEAKFAKDHRFVLGQVLQPGEIAFETRPPLEVNVEAVKIDVRREQILGRWVTCVTVERARIGLAGDLDQLFEKLHAPLGAEPADHRRGNLIANEVAKDCGMPLVLRNSGSNDIDDLSL